jgi:hypothetical protein
LNGKYLSLSTFTQQQQLLLLLIVVSLIQERELEVWIRTAITKQG